MALRLLTNLYMKGKYLVEASEEQLFTLCISISLVVIPTNVFKEVK
jgi:hypothetical protein